MAHLPRDAAAAKLTQRGGEVGFVGTTEAVSVIGGR